MSDVGNYNFELYRGDTFQKTMTISKDLSNTDIYMDIKTTEDGTLIDSSSTINGNIIINSTSSTSSTFTITIPSTTTSTYDFDIAKYDIEFKFTDRVKTYLEGTITLKKDITTE